MYEYEIINTKTNETRYAYGYNFKDACRRKNLMPTEWTILYSEYID